jgi:hypothetical protein
MPSGTHIAEEAGGVISSRTGSSSPMSLIHAAIPFRMSSAKLCSVWRLICRGEHVVSQNLVARRQRMTIWIGGSGVHCAFFFKRANARLTVRWCTTRPKRSAMRPTRRWAVNSSPRTTVCSMKRATSGVILWGRRGPRLPGRSPTRPLRSKSLLAL